jgi:hypothetical protein
MNIKKEAYNRIIECLRKQLMKADDAIKANKNKMFWLVYEQTVLKREKAEIWRVINVIESDKPKEAKT